MYRAILINLGFSTLIFGSSITLDQILQDAKAPQLIKDRLAQEEIALHNDTLANTQADPLYINHALARNSGEVISGYEHEISLSKVVMIGDSQKLKQQASALNNQAYLVEQKKSIIELENRIKNLYHQYCLDKEYLRYAQESYQKFSTLYHKKKRAFEEGEISKTELLQIKLEKSRLYIVLDNLTQQQQSSHRQILSLTTLDTNEPLSCQDTYTVTTDIRLPEDIFNISQEAYQKRIESTQIAISSYNQKIDSVELSVGYTKELESDIYTIGLSVPLNFTSKKPEYAKASLMHHASALDLRNQEQKEAKEFKIRELKERLIRDVNTIQALDTNIEEYRDNLLSLMKKSYDYGESSVVEYLLSQQRLYTLEQELLTNKKEYYQTLFEIYTISETEEI